MSEFTQVSEVTPVDDTSVWRRIFSVEDVRYRFIYNYYFSSKKWRLIYEWSAHASGQQSKKTRWVFSYLATFGDQNTRYSQFSGKQSPHLTQHLRNIYRVLIWYFLHEQKDIVSGFQIKFELDLNCSLMKKYGEKYLNNSFWSARQVPGFIPFLCNGFFSSVASSIWRQFPI